jgi:hypothetical protein
MSKTALTILAAVEGLVIIGLVALLIAGPSAGLASAGWHRALMRAGPGGGWGMPGMMGGYGSGFAGWFGGISLLGLVIQGLLWLIPVALIALVVGLILRPRSGPTGTDSGS